jgi:hypothetical protein
MRSIKWLIIVVGVSALALVSQAPAQVSASPLTFHAKDFGGVGGTTFAFRMEPVKSFSSDNSNQTTTVGGSGLADAPRQDILRVGVLTAKADVDSCTVTGSVTTCTPSTHGTLTGRTIATTDTNTGATKVIVFNWTGEFKVNMDGTGVFTVNAPTALSCFDSTAAVLFATPIGAAPGPPPPPAITTPANCPLTDEGAETYAFVIVVSREKIEFIQTDNSGGGAKIFLTGGARKQDRQNED